MRKLLIISFISILCSIQLVCTKSNRRKLPKGSDSSSTTEQKNAPEIPVEKTSQLGDNNENSDEIAIIPNNVMGSYLACVSKVTINDLVIGCHVANETGEIIPVDNLGKSIEWSISFPEADIVAPGSIIPGKQVNFVIQDYKSKKFMYDNNSINAKILRFDGKLQTISKPLNETFNNPEDKAILDDSNTPNSICGSKDNDCYSDDGAKVAGIATTPLGKKLEYVFANGSSGFKVWKEVGHHRILRANGLDEWTKALNLNGKGQSETDFTDNNIGTDSTRISGRACPNNVYIDDNNKFSTGNCVYYTPELPEQKLDAAGSSQSDASTMGLKKWWDLVGANGKWYVGNIKTCSDIGMRLPTIYETRTTQTNHEYYPILDGRPTFAQANGVPSGADHTWTASTYIGIDELDDGRYWSWSGTEAGFPYWAFPYRVICVLP